MKRDKQYKKLTIHLINGRNINQSLLQLKRNFTYLEYQQCIQILMSNTMYKKQFLNSARITTYSELISEGMFPMLFDKGEFANMQTQIKEFGFLLAYLKQYKEMIADFRDLRDRFECRLLQGNVQGATDVLDDIFETYGLSLWYIEMKILFQWSSGQMDEFQGFYEEIKAKADHKIIYNYFRMLQRKVRSDIINDEYKKFCVAQLTSLSEEFPEEQEMLAYMEFMSFGYLEDVMGDEGAMLQRLIAIAQHLSLIDQYILLDKVIWNIRIQLCDDGLPYTEERGQLLELAQKYENDMGILVFPDFSGEFQWGSEESIIYLRRNVDFEFEKERKCLFQKGAYTDCIEACRVRLACSVRFTDVELLVQSYIAAGENLETLPCETLLDNLVKKMCKMYVKDSDLTQLEIWQTLPRIFILCSFGAGLLDFVYDCLYDFESYTAKKRLFGNLYSRRSISLEHIILLGPEEQDGFLYAWREVMGTSAMCNWARRVRLYFQRFEGILQDEVSRQLDKLEHNFGEMAWPGANELQRAQTNVQRILREQFGILSFERAVERREYLRAFQIYVDMFFLSSLQVIRMNTEALNKRLNLGNCRAFYGELDFAVYACNVELHYARPQMMSEYVKNSFRHILKRYGVGQPSLLTIPEDYWEAWKMAYFLYYVCDQKMLNVINLYGLDAINERRAILCKVSDRYDCRIELERLHEDELNVGMDSMENEGESLQMRAICASWIKIPDHGYVAGMIQKLDHAKQLISGSEIGTFGLTYTDFREYVLKCKNLYIEVVNDKLGTTIRHCILERIMIQNLSKHRVYLRNVEDSQRLLNDIPMLEECVVNDLQGIATCISEFFDRFFLNMDAVRKTIYFSDREEDGRIRFFVPNKFIEEGSLKLSTVRNPEDLRRLCLSVLHKNLEIQIGQLGEFVTSQIREGYTQEAKVLVEELSRFMGTRRYLKNLDRAFNFALIEISQQFKVTYHEHQQRLLSSYLSMVMEQFHHISIENDCDPQLKIRSGIIWNLDIIFKNCIENVEKHAKIPIDQADFRVYLRVSDDNKLHVRFQNRVLANQDELQKTMNQINNNIMKRAYINMDTENDNHGLGYYRIARFLYNNLKESWNLYISFNDGIYCVDAVLGLKADGE